MASLITKFNSSHRSLAKTICKAQDYVEEIRCDAGMMLNPSRCYEMICDDKFEDPTMKHGIGTSCVARCCPGFVLVGNDTVTCQYDGKWSQPEYECVGEL